MVHSKKLGSGQKKHVQLFRPNFEQNLKKAKFANFNNAVFLLCFN